MTISPERQAQLREVLDEIVKTDPGAADLDPSDENDAQTIEDMARLHNGIAEGQLIEYVFEHENGDEEIIQLHPVGRDESGNVLYVMLYDSPGGILSPAGIEAAEMLLNKGLSIEINQLVAE